MLPKRTRWPVVIAAVLLAAILGGLGTVQARQAGEKSRLGDELALVEEGLSGSQRGQAGSSQGEMESRLSETTADLSTAKGQLSRSTDSIIANETLFDLAGLCGVVVTKIRVSPFTAEDLAEVPCSILPVTVTVEGEMPQLIDFIMTLNTSVTNGLVRSASASISVSAEASPSADVRLVIYSYRGE